MIKNKQALKNAKYIDKILKLITLTLKQAVKNEVRKQQNAIIFLYFLFKIIYKIAYKVN